MAITITAIYRYPVAGLSAESLARASLAPGQGLAHDRRFALVHGAGLSGGSRLGLSKEARLAQLATRFDPDSGQFTIERNGKQVLRAKVTEPIGRTLIDQFFAGFLAGTAGGTPKLRESSASAEVSVVNLASLRDLERVVRQPVHPLRFRANIHVDGAPAWSERAWPGRVFTLGTASLEVERPIERCAATNVDPESAARDLNIPLALQRGFGHGRFGVYARVIVPGEIAPGDSLLPSA